MAATTTPPKSTLEALLDRVGESEPPKLPHRPVSPNRVPSSYRAARTPPASPPPKQDNFPFTPSPTVAESTPTPITPEPTTATAVGSGVAEAKTSTIAPTSVQGKTNDPASPTSLAQIPNASTESPQQQPTNPSVHVTQPDQHSHPQYNPYQPYLYSQQPQPYAPAGTPQGYPPPQPQPYSPQAGAPQMYPQGGAPGYDYQYQYYQYPPTVQYTPDGSGGYYVYHAPAYYYPPADGSNPAQPSGGPQLVHAPSYNFGPGYPPYMPPPGQPGVTDAAAAAQGVNPSHVPGKGPTPSDSSQAATAATATVSGAAVPATTTTATAVAAAAGVAATAAASSTFDFPTPGTAGAGNGDAAASGSVSPPRSPKASDAGGERKSSKSGSKSPRHHHRSPKTSGSSSTAATTPVVPSLPDAPTPGSSYQQYIKGANGELLLVTVQVAAAADKDGAKAATEPGSPKRIPGSTSSSSSKKREKSFEALPSPALEVTEPRRESSAKESPARKPLAASADPSAAASASAESPPSSRPSSPHHRRGAVKSYVTDPNGRVVATSGSSSGGSSIQRKFITGPNGEIIPVIIERSDSNEGGDEPTPLPSINTSSRPTASQQDHRRRSSQHEDAVPPGSPRASGAPPSSPRSSATSLFSWGARSKAPPSPTHASRKIKYVTGENGELVALHEEDPAPEPEHEEPTTPRTAERFSKRAFVKGLVTSAISKGSTLIHATAGAALEASENVMTSPNSPRHSTNNLKPETVQTADGGAADDSVPVPTTDEKKVLKPEEPQQSPEKKSVKRYVTGPNGEILIVDDENNASPVGTPTAPVTADE